MANNPSHLSEIWDVSVQMGPLKTLAEVRAKFHEYAVLGYSGAGVVIDKHESVTDLEITASDGARAIIGCMRMLESASTGQASQ